MTYSITKLRGLMQRNAAYRRTLRELNALSLNVKLDLDIAGSEETVARRAVYGH